MTRRSFLHHATMASAAGVLPFQQPRTYKMGLQLFTMRAAMSKDVPGTLKRIAGLGYEEVETYGFDPQGLGYYGMPARTFAQLLRDNNLTTPTGHYDLNRFVTTSEDDLKRYMDRCIEGAKALGQAYVTWPFLDPETRTLDSFKIVARRLNLIGQQAKAAGLLVAYHNHDFEFVDHNGQIGYDIVIKETDAALVKLQMDLYWIARASPVSARVVQAAARALRDVAREGHAQDQPRLHRARQRHRRFLADLSARQARGPSALLRRAGRQLHARPVPQHRRRSGVHEAQSDPAVRRRRVLVRRQRRSDGC